jgi:hypothetical protein
MSNAYRLAGFVTQSVKRLPCCRLTKRADVYSIEGRLYAVCHLCAATIRCYFAGWK